MFDVQYARFAGLTVPVPSWGTNSPFYTEQWAAKDQFWTNPQTIRLYKQHIHAMMHRYAGHLSPGTYEGAVLVCCCQRYSRKSVTGVSSPALCNRPP